MGFSPRLPGLDTDDDTEDITELPHRATALTEVAGATVVATVDTEADEDDWDLPLTEEHHRPVVLAHGTFGNRGCAWATAAPVPRERGYRVFRPDYGKHLGPVLFGPGDIRKPTERLQDFVDEVRRRTGARQVDVVGFPRAA